MIIPMKAPISMFCKYNSSVFGEFPFIKQELRTSIHLRMWRIR